MSFVEYKGNQPCIICGSYENLLINRNNDFELILCEKCVIDYKIVLKIK